MTSIFQSIEQRVCAVLHRKPPTRRWSRVAFWSLAITPVLFLLCGIPGIKSHIGLLPWLTLLVAILTSLPALFHWMRWRLLWRLRNRLFVTYLLIGVTPVVLFGMLAAISAYVLFGQFANFAATSEITRQLTELAGNNRALALHFQHEIVTQESAGHLHALSVPPEAGAILAIPELRVAVYLDGRLQPLDLPPAHALTDVPAPPRWVHRTFSGLVLTGEHDYFRAVTREQAGAHTVCVISSLPLDSAFLARVASGLGRVTLWPLMDLHSQTQDAKSPARSSKSKESQGEVSGGVLPKAQGIFDIPIDFTRHIGHS